MKTDKKISNTPLRKTVVLDASGQAVGRLATQIALALRGKDQPEWLPYLDSGAIVEVTNIKQLRFSGKKLEQKVYRHHSGHPGGLKTVKMSEVYKKDPAQILRQAVRLMLPENRLRAKQLKRLIIK